jgi:hypothetical protein
LTAEATKTGEYEGSLDATIILAGATAIFGKSWDAEASENMMTTTDGVHYTMQKSDITLEALVKYEFKIVIDGQWNGNAGEGKFGSKDIEGKDYPNIEISVAENGVYTINFSVDIEAKTFAVQTTKTGDAEIAEKTWTIAGQAAILGSDWNKDDESNNMTDMKDGTFQLVKKAVTVDAGSYTYKVLANHSWDQNYGDPNSGDKDGNAILEIEEAGTYDITFVFNPESKELYATADAASTGINTIKLSDADSAVMFNLQGQRVTSSFRGIAIKNGRKMIVK